MILIIDFGSSKSKYIAEVIDEHMDFLLVKADQFQEEMLQNAWGVILSGAPILITEQPMQGYLNQMQWIKESEIPVLGICFGHQLIGLLFGAYGSKMKEDRDWQTVEILEKDPLFDKLPTEFKMMEDHCETVSIPQGFKLLATSDACVNEGFKHQTKNIYGVQFHPEVSGNLGNVLLENFTKICTAQHNSITTDS